MDNVFELMEGIDSVAVYINGNGGFTIISWYKRVLIKDIISAAIIETI